MSEPKPISEIIKAHSNKEQSLALLNPRASNLLESLKNPSPTLIENGCNALSLIDSEPLDSTTFTAAKIELQVNYGVLYDDAKMKYLYQKIQDDGWSKERFKLTLDWFIKNKPFPAWTVADWFSFSIKVYPYEWYLKELEKFGADIKTSIERYLLHDGKTVIYRYKDGQELPLKKYEPKAIDTALTECSICDTVHPSKDLCPDCYSPEKVKEYDNRQEPKIVF